MNHTPGPWECETAGQPIIVNGPEDGTSNVICIVEDSACGSEYQYGEELAAANARLITASPDLKDALLRLYQRKGGEGPLWDAARAALLKAGVTLP